MHRRIIHTQEECLVVCRYTYGIWIFISFIRSYSVLCLELQKERIKEHNFIQTKRNVNKFLKSFKRKVIHYFCVLNLRRQPNRTRQKKVFLLPGVSSSWICTKQNTYKKCVYRWGMSHAPSWQLERRAPRNENVTFNSQEHDCSVSSC